MLANTCMWDYRGYCGEENEPGKGDEFDNPLPISVRTDAASGGEMRGMVANFGGFLSINKLRSKSTTQTELADSGACPAVCAQESCGFVVRTPEGERYIPCVNISAEPEAYFRIAPEDQLAAEMQGEIVRLVHSHPGGLPWLSEADRRLQIKSALSWWLVCWVTFTIPAVCHI